MFIDTEQLLNLSAIPGIGPTRIRALIAHFKATDDIFKASIKELASIDGFEYKTAKAIKDYSNFKFGENQQKRANQEGAEIVHFWDEHYPENLKKIYDPPAVLFMRGNFLKQDKYAISIVGTRMPSSYGKVVAEKIARELAKKGIVIVSGLARGIDTISHWAAIHTGARTLAILGSGLDQIYPAENKKLTDAIVHQGALVSEFPMGTKPDAVNFPRRNRIIAGLSLGTIVIEAGLKSGALLTANYALEQNREVFSVPGNINSSKSIGTNQLIKDGAKLVSSVNDVLIELKSQLKHFLKEDDRQQSKVYENLSELEKLLLDNLSNQPIHIDKFASLINKSTAETLSALLPLEFRDLVKQLPGKLFVKI